MTNLLERRQVLLSGIAAAVAAAGSAGFPPALFAQAPVTPEQFIALSEKLTGVPELDPETARTLLGGFLAAGHGMALAELAAGEDVYGPVADAVVAAWYSGVYETGKGQAVASFNDALLWNALTFTKPFASCGGEMGYWADPPQD
jgi:hypothetical protein